MKKTIKELQEIDSVVGSLYQKDQNLEKTKFGYAYKRFCEINYIPHLKKYEQNILDLRIDNALENPTTKEILIDDKPGQRGFKYSKEGLKLVIAAERRTTDDFEKMEIEIKPFRSAHIPEGITEEETELLTGTVI